MYPLINVAKIRLISVCICILETSRHGSIDTVVKNKLSVVLILNRIFFFVIDGFHTRSTGRSHNNAVIPKDFYYIFE